MSRHRLTARKRKFCEALVRGMTQADAARAAGYANPRIKGSKLMRKHDDGRLVDQSVARYMRELTEEVEPPAPPGMENEGATASVGEIGTAEEVIAQLFAILRDGHEPGGTRIRAAETLLKALGRDRPQEVREKDAEAAAAAISKLLGVDRDAG